MVVARRAEGLTSANLLLLLRDGVSSMPLARRALAVSRCDVWGTAGVLSTRGAMLGRRDEEGTNWLVVKDGFARLGVAATWTLGGGGRCDLEEREVLFSV